MVKELIKGILKKKDTPAAAPAQPAPGEEPPDELPPLAEDIAAEPAAAPAQAPPQPEAEPQPPPEPAELQQPPELPPAEFEKHAESVDVATPDDHKEGELPDAIKKAKLAKSVEKEPEPPAEKKEKPEPEKKTEKEEKKESEIKDLKDSVGFFSSVLDHLQKHEGFKDKLLSGDLFSRMSNYWELKKGETTSTIPLSKEGALEKQLVKTLHDLKELEQKWQVQKLAMEEDLRFLQQREGEIKDKADELRRLSNELLLFKNVKPEHYFRLHNGVLLRNLHDLVDALEIIDDPTYHHHVSHEKNDFSEWIRHVFKDERFAAKLRRARTRVEMIQLLQTTPVTSPATKKRAEQLSPSQYFFLSNGVVIKSLAELVDALKAVDDEVLASHLSTDRNDFAAWVRRVYGDEQLSMSLEKAHTKQQLIEAIDVHA